jgi:hypothetical protein
MMGRSGTRQVRSTKNEGTIRMNRVRLAKRLLLPAAVILLSGPGCAEPTRMALAGPRQSGSTRLVWWVVQFEHDVRPPIVGVEVPAGGARTDQWILARHGIRRYAFDGGRQVAAGPPMPAWTAGRDSEFLVPHWLAYDLPESGQPPLPPDAVADLKSMADVVQLLQTRWADQRVPPPSGMTAHAVAEQTDQFPHGVTEFLAVLSGMQGSR